MKKANKFKESLIANIKEVKQEEEKELEIQKDSNNDNSLDRFKNVTKKLEKKSFPIYMEKEKVSRLDRICKKVGRSRNDLLNIIIDEFLEKYS